MDINIKNKLTSEEKELFDILKKAGNMYGQEVYIVGGWVRDKLMEKESDDIDVMVHPSSGYEFAKNLVKFLKENFKEPNVQENLKNPALIQENPDKSKHLETSTVNIPLPSGKIFELDFTSPRKEVYHDNSRIPEIKEATPEEDAFRRDLTINSLFYNINKEKIEDFTGKGIKDLITQTIQTPLDPLKTFKDDPLRIFRAIRFASRYGWDINENVLKAMSEKELLEEINKKVSKERISKEMRKMFGGENPTQALSYLKETGIFENILNEAIKGTEYEGNLAPLDMDQNNPHHQLTVWDHTAKVVENILDFYPELHSEKRVLMVLSAIMHDLGKLYYKIHKPKPERGTTGYGGHEKESANIADLLMKFLKFENSLIKKVHNMAYNHMRPHKFTEDSVSSKKAMRRFIRKIGEDSLDWIDVLNHATADAMSKSDIPGEGIFDKYQSILKSQLNEAISEIKPENQNSFKTILNGNEIMNILNVKAGPVIGEAIDFVKDLMDENPNITKEEATNKVKEKFVKEEPIDTEEQKIESSNVCCSNHLFNQRKIEIFNLIRKNKTYEAMSILEKLFFEYQEDEKILEFASCAILNILVKDKTNQNNNIIQPIFKHAEENFFNDKLNAYVLGILIIIKTNTKKEDIINFAKKAIQLNPNNVKYIIKKLPKIVYHEEAKKEIEEML
jgi:tRNA nucleotidyltransferase (CCA-adding enzyme)